MMIFQSLQTGAALCQTPHKQTTLSTPSLILSHPLSLFQYTIMSILKKVNRIRKRQSVQGDSNHQSPPIRTNTKNTSQQRLKVSSYTLTAMEMECGKELTYPTTIYTLGFVLSNNEQVLFHHANPPPSEVRYQDIYPPSKEEEEDLEDAMNSLSVQPKKKSEEDLMDELKEVFDQLTMQVNSIRTKVQDWEEAKKVLSDVLLLPIARRDTTEEDERNVKESGPRFVSSQFRSKTFAHSRRRNSIQPKVTKRILTAQRLGMKQNHHGDSLTDYIHALRHRNQVKGSKVNLWKPSANFLKQITFQNIPSFTFSKRRRDRKYKEEQLQSTSPKDVEDREEESEMEGGIKEKLDKMLKNQITIAEREARAKEREESERIEKEIAEREKREKEMEEQRLEEARLAASSLLRQLTPEEKDIVNEAINGIGPVDEVIAQYETDSIQRRSMQQLRPGQWLNDEVIHFFLNMLASRDKELCEKDPNRKRCHFFKSFFLTKLFDEGATDQYRYGNVKRWSKKVPGKDLFALDKIFFPMNLSNMHWACAVIYMQEKRIQVYDSMHGPGDEQLRGLMQYVKDEWKAKKGGELPDADEWNLVTCEPDTPSQHNGFDCGVFTCMFADFLSMDRPLAFSQEHITQCRERIALSIMKGVAIQ